MSQAITVLMEDHQLIVAVADALGAFAMSVEKGEQVDTADTGRFVEFIAEFADRKHHAKEEKILFKAMTDSGFPSEGGPISMMLHEHDIGRNFVAGMAEHANQEAWSDASRSAVSRSAAGFADLIRGHIHKEDNILYPMATSRLPADVMASVEEKCAAVEKDWAERGETERLTTVGNQLIERYIGSGS